MLKFRKNNLSNVELCKFLLDVGFTDEEVVKIIFDPSFFITYYDKVDIMVKRGYDYLVGKKFDREKINKMILRYPGILTFSDDKKDKVEEYFRNLGVSVSEYRNMVYQCPNLYGYTIERIDKYFVFFRELGLNDRDTVYVLKTASTIFNRGVSNLKSMVNDLNMYGISNNNIVTISKNYPFFWTHNFSKIKDVINTLISLDFNKEQAISIIIKASSLSGYDIDTIKRKFNDIVMLGFDREDVVNMINSFPVLIISDIDRTRRIVEFYDSIGLRDKMVSSPKSFFMQGIETSYARYMFFKEKNIDINKETYRRLFYGWTWFRKAYGVTREDLLVRYEYKRVDKNDRGIK